MSNGYFKVEMPKNEPVKAYLPGSPERASLKKELERQSAQVVQVPMIIGGKEVWTERKTKAVMPHDHAHVIAEAASGGEKELKDAIAAALAARKAWTEMPMEHRVSIFLKAADLIAGPMRDKVNAATMLGQSKTAYQAEIDTCELIDFLRFNVYYLQQIYDRQPNNTPNVWNRIEYRPLEGFVTAISPFNFTSIGANLPTAPAIAGNVVLWKPATTAVLSNYYVMQALMAAGLPAGVINFVPSRGSDMSKYVLSDPNLAGFHFTGSTEVFSGVYSLVGENIKKYKTYPRLVGETGGKDFIFAHNSADVPGLVAALTRASYEYQGQKCSAASRAFVPASIWPQVKEGMLAEIEKIKIGDITDFRNLMGAVIDASAFKTNKEYIDYAKASEDAEVICGGYDDSKGYFIYPTLIEAKKPDFKTMVEEIFGPVMTVYVYPDDKLDETLASCDTATSYGLSGAIFADDREAIVKMEDALKGTAGNFYINDKPTGAVIGQQPFGGARASGTNDKAGSEINMYRWLSPRTIKELRVPCLDVTYPYMVEA
ncbi:L-glutamate gamma-semialdehyde dehydrogenase [Clostridium sp. AF32-7AC]|uniref:L-glutamate gamma-semialdehyde dehydrogenase n=1 Tax=Clostridium TaxID=1485 RepID=UPI000E4972C0|nr:MULTISPECIES: L-glutamate gamma-semialdehyde dehydrogenase [Clostridium]MBS5462524.1 L-glutamate gamma-semialdehyde dehydrogenase [Clostridium sp.]RGH14397.1 L-glutamate gamma-semialdehyde dehydrogenase [Clostridium sp. AF12-41]RHP42231.1 L-glutamate gamma-semialdehyde dehydrogenase [Clostridium sp. AF32-7AC]RHQ68580.1 L-glutamate gamma-semialdehyde dehydrogenase [Clostridium sp. AF24-2LB]